MVKGSDVITRWSHFRSTCQYLIGGDSCCPTQVHAGYSVGFRWVLQTKLYNARCVASVGKNTHTPGRADWHISCKDYADMAEWPQVCWRPPHRWDRWDVCAALWLLGLPLRYPCCLHPAGRLAPLAPTWLTHTSVCPGCSSAESKTTKTLFKKGFLWQQGS